MMKKRVLALALLSLSVLAGTLFTTSSTASADAVKTGQFAIAQRAIKANGITIPKGTRVKILSTGTSGGSKIAAISISKLSYKVRGLNYDSSSEIVKITNSTFKVSKARASDNIPTYLARGVKAGAASSISNPVYLNITSDGFIETYPILNGKLTKPQAVKITTSTYNSTTHRWYLYSKSRLNTVNQKRVATKGNYQYRLTVANKLKSYKTLNPSKDGYMISHSFAVGGKYFYYTIRTGAA